MSKIRDLTGLKFGQLKVIGRTGSDKWGKSLWSCVCDCENKVIVEAGNLKSGGTTSCGCFKKEKLHKEKTVHGDYKERLFHIWEQMRARCSNKNLPSYKNYGGRGIVVCDAWLNDYLPFKEWALSHGYQNNLSIDRKDNNGNYEPSNCRWATKGVQANNTRSNHFLTFNNQTMTISEWSQKLNISQDIIYSRLKRGWTIEQTLTIPSGGRREND
jgi:hypothetical protein